MLAALRIESFAIIDSLELRFDRGLNVLTGETGAGKSILVDALNLLLGGRGDPEAIRAGCDEAVVEGLFVGEGLGIRAEALGLPASGDELLVRRTVGRTGRGRVHVNGALATVGILGSLLRGFVDVCGQHEHVSLLRREKHLDLLDAYAGLGQARASHERAYGALAERLREREALVAAEAERLRRREFLEFQLAELDEVDPRPGEDEHLSEERRVLASAERLRELTSLAEAALWSGEEAAADRVGSLCRRLEEASRVDGRLAPVVQLLVSAHASLEEAGRELGAYGMALDGDPARLAEIELRLEVLRRLQRLYGSLEAAIEARASMREELASLEGAGAHIERLDEEIEALRAEVAASAAALTSAREEAAARFGEVVDRELGRVGLERASLRIVLSPAAEGVEIDGRRVGRRGAEEAEFYLRANIGEEPRPLARTASGGELSRVLLALKSILASVDPVACYLFDEVDTGISGEAAVTVGQVLREVALSRQVICVTHLPQVAACADTHWYVRKEVADGRTCSRIERLDSAESRRRSIARMLAGTDERPAALAAATELLEASRPAARPRRRRRRAA